MSGRYRLTRRAESDLESIADYTLRQWGRPQMTAYVTTLIDRFNWLAENPGVGRARPEVFLGLRSFREGSHIVFYRERDAVIEIVGVPHMSMDIDAYFQKERDPR
ncbi:MAG: type II toxin-antitoxin system RelE/ParE family toxin [Proteobacteria bacterium]|nr:type II toxin-antitoxin system RelE/ParE family toxin [Pseudomonadota bacterium]MYJ94159.1 type II toxin-antitoxin system RelE/ParE family toxin [Pseudomonadota bacterium]